jgi:ferric-dicitrate binding protein FerR (iron transport regulator)
MWRERSSVEQLALEHRLRADARRREQERTEAKDRQRRRRRQIAMVTMLAMVVGLLIAGVLIGGWPGRIATAVGVAAAPVSAVCDGRTLLMQSGQRRKGQRSRPSLK